MSAERDANADEEPGEWWPIDPETGERLPGAVGPDDLPAHCLGERPLEAAGLIASNIDATFGSSKHFSDEEARRLLEERIVPASVRPHAEAREELLQMVTDLWEWVDDCYRAAWRRPANRAEQKAIGRFAFEALKRY